VSQACTVAGSWLVVSSALGSLFTLVSLVFKLNKTIPQIENRIRMLDVCARNSYVCGILHLCICLCFWMILSRTPYYFLIPPFLVGCMWILCGRFYMKKSDALHALNRSSQLLVNLLATEDHRTDHADRMDLNAPPGVFLVGPEEGYNFEDQQDLEAPEIDLSDSEDKLRVAHGVQVSDISEDDLESFDDEDEGEEDYRQEEFESMPEADTPVEVAPSDLEEEEEEDQ
jgi:hypothetical protein